MAPPASANDTASARPLEQHNPPVQPYSLSNIFSIPTPVKRLFDTVPVLTYPPNELPQSSPKPSKVPSLYIFSSDFNAAVGRPSFNPACLKWQTFLKIAGIRHKLVPSNNHASPSGSLPFLLPPSKTTQNAEVTPITTSKLPKYVQEQGKKVLEPSDPRHAAYQSLIDSKLRNAWLYTLYLDKANFEAVARRLYIAPISSNILVQSTVAHQLKEAAETELLKSCSVIDPIRLYGEAAKAIEALSVVLGDHDWFFNTEEPTLFDASLFAYTHLLLDAKLGWKDERLIELVRERRNLVKHRERILVTYFQEGQIASKDMY